MGHAGVDRGKSNPGGIKICEVATAAKSWRKGFWLACDGGSVGRENKVFQR